MIAPFPNNPNSAEDFDPQCDMDISCNGLMCYARPQLPFNCTVCPTGKRAKKQRRLELSLVYFSTIKPINVTPHSVMQRNCVPMLYDIASSSNEPSLYICPAAMCWAVCLLFLASLLATNTQRFRTASAVVRGLSPILVLVLATAAGSLSSALGCGVMGGASQERYLCQWLKLRPRGGSGLVQAGSRRLRP